MWDVPRRSAASQLIFVFCKVTVLRGRHVSSSSKYKQLHVWRKAFLTWNRNQRNTFFSLHYSSKAELLAMWGRKMIAWEEERDISFTYTWVWHHFLCLCRCCWCCDISRRECVRWRRCWHHTDTNHEGTGVKSGEKRIHVCDSGGKPTCVGTAGFDHASVLWNWGKRIRRRETGNILFGCWNHIFSLCCEQATWPVCFQVNTVSGQQLELNGIMSLYKFL